MAAYTLDGVRQLLQRVVSSGTFTKHFEAVRVVSAGDGKCTAEVTVNENLINNLGTMQGSFSASLVDVISTYALLTLRNVRNVSVDMNMSYVDKAVLGDTVLVEATTTKLGGSTAFLTVDIRNKKTGRLLVKGLHTKHLLNNMDYLGNKLESGATSAASPKA
uniref:Acyl-coenzyme A thioesterase 13 n=1 Tax=Rhipicephalus appendiculatus TaxID=34631 RepID=A0A131YME3_RHIAP